jgi:hypothetical protein
LNKPATSCGVSFYPEHKNAPFGTWPRCKSSRYLGIAAVCALPRPKTHRFYLFHQEQNTTRGTTPLQAINTLIDVLLRAHKHDDETATKLLAIRGYHLPNKVELDAEERGRPIE